MYDRIKIIEKLYKNPFLN